MVYAPTPSEIAQIVAPLFPTATAQELASCRRLDIVGSNFGPAASVTGDSITRVLELQLGAGGGNDTWVRGLTAFDDRNYTSNRIVAYSLPVQAVLRVSIGSKSFNGTVGFTQLSNTYAYSDVSPMISALQGAPDDGYPTTGGPGNVMILQASGLSSTIMINVTVGTPPFLVNCKLLALDGTTYVGNTGDAIAMLAAQSGGLLRGTFVYTIKAEVPPGQGKNQQVLVWRNGAPSGVTEAGVNLMSYAKPVVTAAGTYDDMAGAYMMRPFAPNMDLRVNTAGTTRLKLTGSNFGICPSVTILHRNDELPTVMEACFEVTDNVTGIVSRVPNPAVVATHTSFEVVIPAGEGTGLLFNLLGWYVALGAGEGLARQTADAMVPIRYAVPTVRLLTNPWPIDTSGQKPLYITGSNFGFLTTPIISLVNSAAGISVPCTNVTRFSHEFMTCVVQPGVGSRLSVQITVADQTGWGGLFNFTQPMIDTMSIIPLTASANTTVVSALMTGNVLPEVVAASVVPVAAANGDGPVLRGNMHGGDVIVLQGSSFGAPNPTVACAFVASPEAWGSNVVLGAPPIATDIGTPSCDGAETFLGEGEVYSANSTVLYWNHSTVIFRAPPGVSGRTVTVLVGGQMPSQQQLYVNWRYNDARLTAVAPTTGVMSTDGGDLLDLLGDFALRTVNSVGNATERILRFPLAHPLKSHMMLPTEQLRIDFTSPSAVVHCLATAYAADGGVAAGFSSCRSPALHSITPDTTGTGVDRLTVVMPPGVGANKTLAVSYIAVDGTTLMTTEVGNFSYDAPQVRSLNPDLILSLDSMVPLYIFASNVGRLRDLPLMTAAEQRLSVMIGNTECLDATRVLKNQQDQVQVS